MTAIEIHLKHENLSLNAMRVRVRFFWGCEQALLMSIFKTLIQISLDLNSFNFILMD